MQDSETARLAFFFASPRHLEFLDRETESSKCFETPRHLRIKKRDCETREFRLKLGETQSF